MCLKQEDSPLKLDGGKDTHFLTAKERDRLMRLYLIRHGRQNSKLCNVNVPLSEEGRRQAVLLGERLSSLKIEAVYSSDLLRAEETARIANGIWGVEHATYPELREISFGQMEGLSDEVIEVQFADFKRRRREMKEDMPYPGGECAGDVVARALPVLQKIAETGYEHVAIVTHGGVIRSLAAKFLGMELSHTSLLGSSLENCSITELSYKRNRFLVERFNDYAHLEAEPELLRCNWNE